MSTQTEKKRRPGIPHETLSYIAEQGGGVIEHHVIDRETWVKLKIGDRIFTAPNNTALLIQVFEAIGK